jgi:hypothetical protein
MIDKLYISTVNYNWSNTDLALVDSHNIDKLIGKVDVVDCHTSVDDLTYQNINKICSHVNEIILVDIDENVKILNSNCFSYGRLFNELDRHPGKVKNFNWNKNFNYLINTRPNNDPVVWTAGCSFTVGQFVDHKDRWGTLLADYLNLPEVTLAQCGSSIYWAADQILRSDIREGDMVVWGLTNIQGRTEISHNWNFSPTLISAYTTLKKENQYWTLDYFESETGVLVALREILQVINFCQKIKVKLYLANLFDLAWLRVALKAFENFIDLTQDLPMPDGTPKFLDFASDNSHPGPKQHRQYAEKLYNFIKESNHGKTV